MKKDGNRGYVRGLSMWPNLIPGDILVTEEICAEQLQPEMIALFPDSASTFMVHRVLSTKLSNENIIFHTGGDRSGPDQGSWSYNKNESIVKVTGVLRKGKYRAITQMSIPRVFSTTIIVKLYNKIIRALFW